MAETETDRQRIILGIFLFLLHQIKEMQYIVVFLSAALLLKTRNTSIGSNWCTVPKVHKSHLNVCRAWSRLLFLELHFPFSVLCAFKSAYRKVSPYFLMPDGLILISCRDCVCVPCLFLSFTPKEMLTA